MKKFYENAEKRTAEILNAPRKKEVASGSGRVHYPNRLKAWPLAVLSGIFLVTAFVLCVQRFSSTTLGDEDLPMVGAITIAPFAFLCALARMVSPVFFFGNKCSKVPSTIDISTSFFEILVDLLGAGFAGFPHATDADQYGLLAAYMFMVDVAFSAAGFGWSIYVLASRIPKEPVERTTVQTRARDLNRALQTALLCFDEDRTVRSWESISNFRTTIDALEEDFRNEGKGGVFFDY